MSNYSPDANAQAKKLQIHEKCQWVGDDDDDKF